MANKNDGKLEEKKHGITKDQARQWAQDGIDAKIPGKGFLFHVKDEHLPETTRLNLQEAVSLAITDMQQYAIIRHTLPVEQHMSLYEYFRNRLMRYRISCGGEDWGEGRKESIVLHQLSQDEKEAIKGSMFNEP